MKNIFDIANDELQKKIIYSQERLASCGIPMSIEIDWESFKKFVSIHENEKTLCSKIEAMINDAVDGFYSLSLEEELKEAVFQDVQKISISLDDFLTEDPCVEIINSKATFFHHYDKYSRSNLSKPMKKIIYEVLPSASLAAQKKWRKEIDKTLANATSWFRKDQLLELNFKVRWNEFDGQREDVLKGLERFIGIVSSDIFRICGYMSFKNMIAEKVKHFDFGFLSGHNPPPVLSRLEGDVLYMAFPPDLLTESKDSPDFRESVMRALGVTELKNY